MKNWKVGKCCWKQSVVATPENNLPKDLSEMKEEMQKNVYWKK